LFKQALSTVGFIAMHKNNKINIYDFFADILASHKKLDYYLFMEVES